MTYIAIFSAYNGFWNLPHPPAWIGSDEERMEVWLRRNFRDSVFQMEGEFRRFWVLCPCSEQESLNKTLKRLRKLKPVLQPFINYHLKHQAMSKAARNLKKQQINPIRLHAEPFL